MKIISLDTLPINFEAKISRINCNEILKRRLLDLGLINGTKIMAILKSPLGNPIAYKIRGATIALRKEDSKLINVNID